MRSGASRRWFGALGVAGVATVLLVLLLSGALSRGGTPGEQAAAFLSGGKDSSGGRLYSGSSDAIPVQDGQGILKPPVPQGDTFPLYVLGVSLHVPRDVKAVSVSDRGDFLRRPDFGIAVRGPLHGFARDVDSNSAYLIRDLIAERNLDVLAKLMAKSTDLSRADAEKGLTRARSSLLVLSDEELLRCILRADKKSISQSEGWDQATSELVSLMARDWVWDIGDPCYRIRGGEGETVYMVGTRQSHPRALMFFVAAFDEDEKFLWSGEVGSKPPSGDQAALGFLKQVLGEPETSPPVD